MPDRPSSEHHEPTTLRSHLDKAGEEIVAAHPFRALGHINSALAILDAAEMEFNANPGATMVRLLVPDHIDYEGDPPGECPYPNCSCPPDSRCPGPDPVVSAPGRPGNTDA